ncbi:MAG: hypothetical protein WC707_06970 [Candidatus Babeliaceae bacterium]|jgi:hypothetical protein
MATFTFSKEIEASDYTKAKELHDAAIGILTAARTQLTDAEFLTLAKKIVKTPSVVKKALKFL